MCCLRLNNEDSEFFQNNYGTLEGAVFALFIDLLLRELEDSGLGLCCGNTEAEKVSKSGFC